MKRFLVAFAGVAGFFLPQIVGFPGLSPAGAVALGLFLFAAVFWLLEPVPIYATSMLVIFLQLLFLSNSSPFVRWFSYPYPVVDAPAAERFLSTLANPILILFLGGFLLAAACVKYSVEKNLTRILLKPFGDSPKRILFGIMLSTAVLSAFMSNTATTAMMITVILPLLSGLRKGDKFRVALALSIPVAANLGGIATPIGTPPNAVAIAALAQAGAPVTFGGWMLLAIPLVVVSLALAWWLLILLFPPEEKRLKLALEGEFQKSRGAIIMYCVGGLTVLLWVTENFHGIPGAVVAFFPVALLPALGVVGKEEIRGISWEVLWLVAGGISLGYSLQDTGLAAWMITLVEWNALTPWMLVAGFLGVSILLANFLSHTVTATLLIPVAMGLGTSGVLGGALSAVSLAVAIAIGSSYGMSLPISTPPNAIAMSTGLVTTRQMAGFGIWMAVAGFLLTLAAALAFWPHLANLL